MSILLNNDLILEILLVGSLVSGVAADLCHAYMKKVKHEIFALKKKDA